jgi:glycolate oxidase FAD binding subunit
MSDRITIAGLELPLVRPGTVTELCEQVSRAEVVYPVGGGTSLDDGGIPTKPGVAISTIHLNQVIDYPARDLTITVQAGLTFAKLAEVLATEGQYLPIDVPHPERATIGGAMATNWSGGRRLTHGTLRDAVIGLTVVNDEGQEVKGGGRVVKNVAGYDLMKLMIGSMGTLGIITQVTLKVKPKPEATGGVRFDLGNAAVGPTLDRLHESKARPAMIELGTIAGGWRIECGFEEKNETVAWQQRTLMEELRGAPVQDVQQFAGLPELAPTFDDGVLLKVNVPPSRVADVALAARAASPQARILAQAGSGIVYVHQGEDSTKEQTATLLGELNRLTTMANCNVVVVRCPVDWKRTFSLWGRDSGDRFVMKKIKKALDGRAVFNPERFLV